MVPSRGRRKRSRAGQAPAWGRGCLSTFHCVSGAPRHPQASLIAHTPAYLAASLGPRPYCQKEVWS